MKRRILLLAAAAIVLVLSFAPARADALCARAYYPNLAAYVCVPLP